MSHRSMIQHPVVDPSQFVEDEGNIIFYKNASGLAATRPKFTDGNASDSGVEVDKL